MDFHKLVESFVHVTGYLNLSIEFKYDLRILLHRDGPLNVLCILANCQKINLYYENQNVYLNCIKTFLDEYSVTCVKLTDKRGVSINLY